MADYHFTKNSPSSHGMACILSKIDLGFAAYGVTVMAGLLMLLLMSPDSVYKYAAENPEQEDIVMFLNLTEQEQYSILGIYLLWYIFELLLAVIFFFGARNKSFCLLKIWIIVTILNLLLGLLSTVPAYMYTSHKHVFIVFALIVYMYRLYCIYLVDCYLREIVGRRAAAVAAAMAAYEVAKLL